jgi:hypothetical protein
MWRGSSVSPDSHGLPFDTGQCRSFELLRARLRLVESGGLVESGAGLGSGAQGRAGLGGGVGHRVGVVSGLSVAPRGTSGTRGGGAPRSDRGGRVFPTLPDSQGRHDMPAPRCVDFFLPPVPP